MTRPGHETSSRRHCFSCYIKLAHSAVITADITHARRHTKRMQRSDLHPLLCRAIEEQKRIKSDRYTKKIFHDDAQFARYTIMHMKIFPS